MNYVGSINILDRGDAPAQAVISKNARSLAQRAADETKDELQKVMARVDNIYGNFDMASVLESTLNSNMEYLEDIQELEVILKDQIKKKKYQQQVTIFIVGFEDVSRQKLTLIKQVNDFFLANSKSLEQEDLFPTTPDIDLDDVSAKIEDSLNTAEELTHKLADINKEMVVYLTNYANNKGGNKGRKKLEKSLQQAKDDINMLSEKLLVVGTELEEKEEKMSSLFKQVETKNMEIQRYKSAAEVAKKNMRDTEGMQEELDKRGALIGDLQKHVQRMELEIAQASNSQELSQARVDNASQENLSKIEELQKQVNDKSLALDEARKDLQNLHNMQILSLQEAHQVELDDMRQNHAEEIRKLLGEIDQYRQELQEIQDSQQDGDKASVTEIGDDRSEVSKVSHTSSREETRSTGKESQKSKHSSSTSKKSSKQSSKGSSKSRSEGGTDYEIQKEYAEVAIQDEGGDPDAATVDSRATRLSSGPSKSQLGTVREDSGDFGNAFNLKDNESWANVPAEHVEGRFRQYRKLSTRRIEELEEQLKTTVSKTQRKVDTLKEQFKEHKSKWETERHVLVEQIEQTIRLQSEAEKEADAAMSQLEGFINEQEKLEIAEDQKRLELSRNTTRSAEEAQAQLAQQHVGDLEGTEKGEVKEDATEDNLKSEISPESGDQESGAATRTSTRQGEPDLDQLLQQTDDAKELRRSATTVSIPPTIETPEAEIDPGLDLEQAGLAESFSITGATDEEVRASSARSRASLRSQYRNKLDETRLAAEDRRSKSPAISVPSLLSLEDDQLVEDDDDDIDIPIPDDDKEEFDGKFGEMSMDIGTSPPPPPEPLSTAHSLTPRKSVARSSISHSVMGDNRVVQEYLKTYDGVVSFKDGVTKLLIDKDMMTASQVLSDLETILFDKGSKVQPQIERMTHNVFYMLDELNNVLNTVLINEREPCVSSLTASREQTRAMLLTREKSEDSGRGLTGTRGSTRTRSAVSHHSIKSNNSDSGAIRDLKETCARLQIKLEEDSKKHEEQLRHNTVVMMEMQDTINELQRELSTLGSAEKTQELASQETVPESCIMFTRLDSERNAKIMKKAVYEERLDPERYKEAVNQMDDYVTLPAQRLSHLVRKYVHHCHMKQIEENVRLSRSLNENVFEILDKMEDLQSKRANRWADKMDDMGLERERLANLLMETFDNIEEESGIFLIKPMYSYRGRDSKEKSSGKLSRHHKPGRSVSPRRERGRSAYAPAPTPATTTRPGTRHSYAHGMIPQVQSDSALFSRRDPHSLEGDPAGLSGAGMTWTGSHQPRPVWNLSSSQAKDSPEDSFRGYTNQSYNTPRILELDINRMLIGQNNISTKMRSSLPEDRISNISHSALRSYVTVNRPTAGPKHDRLQEGPAPPSTPRRPLSVEERRNSDGVRRMQSSPPLPPISQSQRPSSVNLDNRSNTELPYPPRSPPGSSLRQTPPTREIEVFTPLGTYS